MKNQSTRPKAAPKAVSFRCLLVLPVGTGTFAEALAGADLPRRNTHVSRMDTYASTVEDVVASVSTNAGALHADVRQWSQDAIAFVASLDVAVNALDTSGTTSYETLRSSVFNTKSTLAIDQEKLRLRFEALRKRIAAAKIRLEMLEKPDRKALLYGQGADASEKIAARIVASLTALDGELVKVHGKVWETWDPAWQKAQLALESWLSTANVPDWQAKVADLKRWFVAHEAAESFLFPLEAKVEAFKDLVMQGRPYVSKARAAAIETECAAARTKLASDAVFEPIRPLATERLGIACKAARDRLAVLWGNPDFVPELLLEFAKKQSQFARASCAKGEAKYDCRTASWLAKIPKAKVLAMGEAELRIYEDTWAKAMGLSGGGTP